MIFKLLILTWEFSYKTEVWSHCDHGVTGNLFFRVWHLTSLMLWHGIMMLRLLSANRMVPINGNHQLFFSWLRVTTFRYTFAQTFVVLTPNSHSPKDQIFNISEYFRGFWKSVKRVKTGQMEIKLTFWLVLRTMTISHRPTSMPELSLIQSVLFTVCSNKTKGAVLTWKFEQKN